jgi:hypothetical protein
MSQGLTKEPWHLGSIWTLTHQSQAGRRNGPALFFGFRSEKLRKCSNAIPKEREIKEFSIIFLN